MLILKKIRHSLAYQVVAFIIAFAVLIFALMLLMHNHLTRSIMFSNAKTIARSITYESISRLENILSKVETQTAYIAFNLRQNPHPNVYLSDYIQSQLISNNEFESIRIAYKPTYQQRHPDLLNGLFYVEDGSLREVKTEVSDSLFIYEEWYAIPEALKTVYWTEPWYVNTIAGNLVSSFAMPMFDEKNDVVGVVRLDVSLHVLQTIVGSVKMLDTGYAMLASHNGTIVTHPADSLIMNYSVFSYAKQIGSVAAYNYGLDMVQGKEKLASLDNPSPIDKSWIYVAPIRKNGWAIGVIFSENELFADLNKITFVFSLILGIGLFLIISMVYLRIVKRLKPLSILAQATDKIGTGDFEADLPTLSVHNEISSLSEGLNAMQHTLKSYMENLLSTGLAKEKIESDVRFASEVQKNLIPSPTALQKLPSAVSVCGLFEPAGVVGGDLYDVFMINEKKLCFVIADVFGKGIVASMTMVMVQSVIKSIAKHVHSVKEQMHQINRFLSENNTHANFVTMLLGWIDLETLEMEFCNAGHTPLYLRNKANHCVRFGETHCTALGIFTDLSISSSVLQLDNQDEIIIFTDGITEAMNSSETFFGYQRLENVFCNVVNNNPEIMVSTILNEVKKFTNHEQQSDDISILVIKINHSRKTTLMGKTPE